jgi:1,2-phenylacetyl-CoA epoxidase catalytic subunit
MLNGVAMDQFLEQDIAITNISLDLLGQARNFYQYAAELINKENTNNEAALELVTEDSLAYLRLKENIKIYCWWNNPTATGDKRF